MKMRYSVGRERDVRVRKGGERGGVSDWLWKRGGADSSHPDADETQ